jgi:hypothetical protein
MRMKADLGSVELHKLCNTKNNVDKLKIITQYDA